MWSSAISRTVDIITGSNVFYNIKKLTECGYPAQECLPHDRWAGIHNLQNYLAALLRENPRLESELQASSMALSQLERAWTDYVRHGRKR